MQSKKTRKTGLLIVTLLLSVLMLGCGKKEEAKTQAEQPGQNASGDAILVREPTRATDDMNQENEAAKPKQEEPSGTEQVIVPPEELIEPEIPEQPVKEEVPEAAAVNKLQIVFLGDSILDGYRNETGIAYLTGVNCDADVYNLAIGGTTAALTTYENATYEKWDSSGLQGVVHAICGNISPSILDGHRAAEAFAKCDFSQTDYFVIEYGMNDFLAGIPLNDEEDFYDEYTYVGALRIAISKLREYYPEATIILCSPNYAQFWGKEGMFLGDGNVVNNGGGTLVEYYRVCGNVSADMNTLFLNAYEGIGLDTYTASEYLEDGIHLSEKGRFKYAEKLSEIILNYEAEKNN